MQPGKACIKMQILEKVTYKNALYQGNLHIAKKVYSLKWHAKMCALGEIFTKMLMKFHEV